MRSSARFGRDQDSASRIGAGQWRARRHGNAGIHGKVGIVESITCRIYRRRLSSNPTLSANRKRLTLGHYSFIAFYRERLATLRQLRVTASATWP